MTDRLVCCLAASTPDGIAALTGSAVMQPSGTVSQKADQLTDFLLRGTFAGSTYEKRITDATPYPLPAGSRLLQNLGFQAFTLDQVEVIMPTRKPPIASPFCGKVRGAGRRA